jgi:hypothetical protein
MSTSPLSQGNGGVLQDRREFLKRLSRAGVALSAGPMLLGACGGDGHAGTGLRQESRRYFLNVHRARPGAQYFLVAGVSHHPLVQATEEHLLSARAIAPGLPGPITHVVDAVALPGDAPQLCFIKGVHGPDAADWHMHSMFIHVPQGALATARAAAVACAPRAKQGTGVAAAAADEICGGELYDHYKSYIDHAVSLIVGHPEVMCFDSDTLAYIQQAIVCRDQATLTLAGEILDQGDASTQPGGWATLEPLLIDDLPQYDNNGQQLFHTTYSARTMMALGKAIASIMPKIKDDVRLGGNVTPGQSRANLKGTIWSIHDGQVAVTSTPGQAVPSKLTTMAAAVATGFTQRDVSVGPGFRFTSVSASDRTISFEAYNWYLRYLGVHVRFLDAAGNPIRLDSLDQSALLQFPHRSMNGTYDAFVGVTGQEFVILGIPVDASRTRFSVKLPPQAASLVLLASGIGVGANPYPDTLSPGAVMTGLIDLALPGLFLASSAALGYAKLIGELSQDVQTLIEVVENMLLFLSDVFVWSAYDDPQIFLNMVPRIGTILLKTVLWPRVKSALGFGEGVSQVPFIGWALQAAAAAQLASSLITTSVDVARSPRTYAIDVGLTHAVTVTIQHDPDDTAGFPATATHYQVTAICDGSSPRTSGLLAMPATTRTEPISFTFSDLPYGGKVNFKVVLTSSTGWLAGAGTTGPIDNLSSSASITIKENLVPITRDTRYRHRQKTALVNGERVWLAAERPDNTPLASDNVPGKISDLTGITLSEPFAAIGFSWRSYSSAVTAYGSGSGGHLHRFANISFTQFPQRGFMASPQGFIGAARIAYDLNSSEPDGEAFYVDASTGGSIVRRIRMKGIDKPPEFDAPQSNRAVGRFQLASDAFVVHPTGKLISFNAENSKIEILDPDLSAPADSYSPLSRMAAGPGTREGLLLGPVRAAVRSDGCILVIEQGNNRIQAFDAEANPARVFAGNTSCYMPLQNRNSVRYEDLAVEFTGLIYVLAYDGTQQLYVLDIYAKDGSFLSTTTDIRASKLAIDLFRNAYMLNFERLSPASTTLVEPTISQWIPSTP